MREQLGDFEAALAPFLKRPVGLPQQSHLTEKDVGLFVGREFRAVKPIEGRLGIEGIDVAQASDEADVDGPLGTPRRNGVSSVVGPPSLGMQQCGEGGRCQTLGSPVEEFTSRQRIVGHHRFASGGTSPVSR